MNRNWLRAVAAVCVGAAVFLAAALGGLPGIVLALAGIAAVVMAAMFLAERVALRALRARAVSEVEYPELYRVVREICKAALLPVPRVYVSPAPQPNSFAIGRDRRISCWPAGCAARMAAAGCWPGSPCWCSGRWRRCCCSCR